MISNLAFWSRVHDKGLCMYVFSLKNNLDCVLSLSREFGSIQTADISSFLLFSLLLFRLRLFIALSIFSLISSYSFTMCLFCNTFIAVGFKLFSQYGLHHFFSEKQTDTKRVTGISSSLPHSSVRNKNI